MGIVSRMDHFTILTDKLDTTLAFYERLGLEPGERPNIPTPGSWLYAGGRPILHIIGVDKLPEHRRGVLDHVAFRASDLRATVAMLECEGVNHRITRLAPPFGTWQIFFDDPNGAKVELDFDPTETPPDGY